MTIGHREFEALEDDIGVFDIRVDGVPVWEAVRSPIFGSIQKQTGLGQAHTKIEHGARAYVRGFFNWLKNWVHRNPFFADSSDIMFVGHPRRKLCGDGLWWDPYCDPIHTSCDFNSVHFEKAYLLGHMRPAKTEEIRYLDLIQYGAEIQQKLGIHQVSIPPEESKKLQEIEREITRRFDASVDVEGRVMASLERRLSEMWLFENLINRVDPEVLVTVVSYGREPLIEASQNQGIPVVELQHGVIDRQALGYHFPGDRVKERFPDYFLAWGEYWREAADFPIDESRLIAVGYPFLEQAKGQYNDINRREQILFISQGTVGEKLSKFAVEVGSSDMDYKVVYKLHPGEYDRWDREYPWLVNSNVSVITDDSKPLYQLFKESTAQVGAYSTAVYEGLSFGLTTYLLDLPRVDQDGYLQKNDFATIVSSPEEIITALERDVDRNTPDLAPIFRPNATKNVCKTLGRIVQNV